MRNALILSGAALALAACDQSTPAATDPGALPFIGGYRAPDDACRRLGENDYTAEFLDHTRDLVACPVNYAGLDSFIAQTGAVELDRVDGYAVLSVPLG